MPRIPQNSMLNAGMMLNTAAMNIGCSTRAIRHLRKHFQATGRTEDLPRSGRQRVTTRGKDCYILNTHLRNRFQNSTATAANTHNTHNNRISAQTVHRCLSAPRPYVGRVLALRQGVNRVNRVHTH